MKGMWRLALYGLLLALTGCAADPTLMTINTQPVGAYITEIGSAYVAGTGPVTVQYQKSSLQMRDSAGCALVKGFKAQWISGATASTTDTIRLCGNQPSYAISLDRDPAIAGLEKDLEFALKVKATNAQQRQAAAAEDAAALQFLGVMQQSAPVTCTTFPIGKSVQTNCR